MDNPSFLRRHLADFLRHLVKLHISATFVLNIGSVAAAVSILILEDFFRNIRSPCVKIQKCPAAAPINNDLLVADI